MGNWSVNSLPCAMTLKASGRFGMPRPDVSRKTMPRATCCMPSVAISGLTPTLAMIRPLTRPTAAPVPRPTRMATGAATPNLVMTIAGHRAGQRQRCADRQVEAAGDQQDRHADGDDGVERQAQDQGGQVGLAQEVRRCDPQPGGHDQDHEEDAQLALFEQPRGKCWGGPRQSSRPCLLSCSCL